MRSGRSGAANSTILLQGWRVVCLRRRPKRVKLLPYELLQRNAYKETQYPTWNLVKQLAQEGKLTPEAALFAADRKPVEELFDVTADPHEIKNLALDPKHAAKLRELRGLVDTWVVESGDKGGVMEDPLDIFKGYNGRLPEETESTRPAGKKK